MESETEEIFTILKSLPNPDEWEIYDFIVFLNKVNLKSIVEKLKGKSFDLKTIIQIKDFTSSEFKLTSEENTILKKYLEIVLNYTASINPTGETEKTLPRKTKSRKTN